MKSIRDIRDILIIFLVGFTGVYSGCGERVDLSQYEEEASVTPTNQPIITQQPETARTVTEGLETTLSIDYTFEKLTEIPAHEVRWYMNNQIFIGTGRSLRFTPGPNSYGKFFAVIEPIQIEPLQEAAFIPVTSSFTLVSLIRPAVRFPVRNKCGALNNQECRPYNITPDDPKFLPTSEKMCALLGGAGAQLNTISMGANADVNFDTGSEPGVASWFNNTWEFDGGCGDCDRHVLNAVYCRIEIKAE